MKRPLFFCMVSGSRICRNARFFIVMACLFDFMIKMAGKWQYGAHTESQTPFLFLPLQAKLADDYSKGFVLQYPVLALVPCHKALPDFLLPEI